jgi:cyclophilin family peptidyl-prolyl cis-trans isomerase
MVGALLSLAGCGSAEDGDPGAEPAETDETAAAPATSAENPGGELPGTGTRPTTASAASVGLSGPGLPGGRRESKPSLVELETSKGKIVIELDRENAPVTVENFLQYVDGGFYNGTIFHQVWPGAVILGGAYTPDLSEKPAGAPIPNEANNGLSNVRGTIAMARQADVINSATCQFFINVKDNPYYDYQSGAQESLNGEDYGYCVFGRVTPESMKVVDAIAKVEVQDTEQFPGKPVDTVLIDSARTVR